MSVNNENIGPIVSNGSLIKSSLNSFSQQLKIAHINCQSIKPFQNVVKFDEFKNIVRDSFDLIAISETWLKPYVSNLSIRLENCKVIRNDRLHRRGGGVCIYLKSNLQHKLVFQISTDGCESIFIEVNFNNVKTLFGVVYLPHGDISAFETLHYDLLLKYSNIIIVGDFNCNMFNPVKSSQMRSMCVRFGISVHHNSRPTHFDIVHRSTSLLDYWLVSDQSMISYSSQVQCPAISHHSLIYAAFRFTVERSCEVIEYRNFNAIDWNGLLAFLSGFDSYCFFSSADVNFQNSIIDSLVASLYCFVPIVRRKVRRDNNTWMKSRAILLATSLRDLAYSAFLSSRSTENWAIFCRYRNRAKNIIRKEKRKFYASLFSDLDGSGVWKVLKGSGCIGTSEWSCNFNVNDINQSFVNNSYIVDDNFIDFGSFDAVDGLFSFNRISENDVYEAICKVKSKSIGVDKIPIRFFKTIYPYISLILTHHVNTIFLSSAFPSSWKTARVVPIPKSKNIRDFEDLRPISILPALSKAVEHIMKDQILSFVRNSIVSSQYAFRRGHSTTSLLLSLTDDIRCHLNDNRVATLVSLDLTKAFNSVNFRILIRKLREIFNFSATACKLIYSYLTDRVQFVDVNNIYSNLLHLTSGVPQGSVLGPILFTLYVNDLSSYIDNHICKSFLFADDVLLLFNSGKSEINNLCLNINDILQRFLYWSNENCLSINSSKTKALAFGINEQQLLNLNIHVGDTCVNFVDRLKCLGIYLDKCLNFETHIDNISWKVSGLVRQLYSTNIYLPQRIKLRLAHAVLMPQILYGLEVFSGSMNYITSKLGRIANTIVRYVYGVRRNDHISEYVKRFMGCSFGNLITLRNLVFFYKIIKSGFPTQLYSKFLFSHSTRNPQIILPRINNALFERSFIVRIARRWNTLPIELRVFSHSNNAFRVKILAVLTNL